MNGKEVWETIQRDPKFQKQPLTVQAALRPFVEVLPEILHDNLEQTVTMQNLFDGKMTWLVYALSHDYIPTVVAAIPGEQFSRTFTRDRLGQQMKRLTQKLLEELGSITVNLGSLLKSLGLTERDFMLTQAGLSEAACELYAKGELTIEKLLTIQPLIFIENG